MSPVVPKPKPAPECTLDKEAHELLEKHGALALANAMAYMSLVSELTVPVIRGLGMCTAQNICMNECKTSAELAAVRKAIVVDLVKADTKPLLALGKNRPAGTSKNEAATLVISRLVTAVSSEFRAGGPDSEKRASALMKRARKAPSLARARWLRRLMLPSLWSFWVLRCPLT